MARPKRAEGQGMPSAAVLDDVAVGKAPLHARVREQLRELALRQFKDGDRFFSEPLLIERLGVSQGTIRRAMGDLAREGLLIRKVPSGTFVSKPAARALAVEVFMPQWESPFLMAILEQLSRRCRALKQPLRVHHTHGGETIEAALLQVGDSPGSSRVILLGETPQSARALYAALSKRGYRVVNIDTLMPSCGDAYVGVDNDAGIRVGMDYLTGLGHRRIVLLVNEPIEAGNTRARIQAFEAYCREAGLSGACVVDCGLSFAGDSIRSTVGGLEQVLAMEPRPTAIFTVSDPGAWIVLRLLSDRDIRVPGAVTVLGFDDDRASEFMLPALSTLAQPVAAIAKRALELLLQDAPPLGMVLLPPMLVKRKSTGPAPKA